MNNYMIIGAMKNVNSAVRGIWTKMGLHGMTGMQSRMLRREEGSAVIGEVLVMIVVVAMAAIFKSGGLDFIKSIWTTMTQTASTMFS